jgi:hypothetical protein
MFLELIMIMQTTNKKKLELPRLEMPVTMKCTLRCRDCCNGVSLYPPITPKENLRNY